MQRVRATAYHLFSMRPDGFLLRFPQMEQHTTDRDPGSQVCWFLNVSECFRKGFWACFLCVSGSSVMLTNFHSIVIFESITSSEIANSFLEWLKVLIDDVMHYKFM